MSQRTQAKKARRRKRQGARDLRRRVGEVLTLEAVDDVLTGRGWEFDVDNSTDEIATWFFADSAIDRGDDAIEVVTRIWVGAQDEDTWHVIFVGGDAEAVDYIFSAESLLENLAAIEEYRQGDPPLEFD